MVKGGLADEASLAQRLICHSVSLELAYRPQPWGLFDTAQRLSGKPEDKAKDHDPFLLPPHWPEMRSRHSCDHCFPLPGTLVKPQTFTVKPNINQTPDVLVLLVCAGDCSSLM